jgi:hypothetical protein
MPFFHSILHTEEYTHSFHKPCSEFVQKNIIIIVIVSLTFRVYVIYCLLYILYHLIKMSSINISLLFICLFSYDL